MNEHREFEGGGRVEIGDFEGEFPAALTRDNIRNEFSNFVHWTIQRGGGANTVVTEWEIMGMIELSVEAKNNNTVGQRHRIECSMRHEYLLQCTTTALTMQKRFRKKRGMTNPENWRECRRSARWDTSGRASANTRLNHQRGMEKCIMPGRNINRPSGCFTGVGRNDASNHA